MTENMIEKGNNLFTIYTCIHIVKDEWFCLANRLVNIGIRRFDVNETKPQKLQFRTHLKNLNT